MNTKKEITKYVTNIFNRYDATRFGFFRDYDAEQDATVDIPLFPYTEVDEETLGRIGVHLGLSVDEILTMDKDAAERYWNKYPFFRLYKEFKDRWSWNTRFKNEWVSPEERLIDIIFGGNKIEGTERYDYPSVIQRMIDNLKSFDKVMPGTYHPKAKITNLKIQTEVFFSFPQCTSMIRSFVDMVNRCEELFFKAISNELPQEEQNELNFLASWLCLSDAVSPRTTLVYENVRLYRHVYQEENLKDFFSYAKVKRFVDVSPWRCQEFFDDAELVQKFVNIFPQARAEMRQFAVDVTKFHCDFVWSDAKPIMYSPEEEAEMSSFNAIMGWEDIPPEQREREHTTVYVDKTVEEMFGWEENARKIHAATAPSSQGGLTLPIRECPVDNSAESMRRIQNRVSAAYGGFPWIN